MRREMQRYAEAGAAGAVLTPGKVQAGRRHTKIQRYKVHHSPLLHSPTTPPAAHLLPPAVAGEGLGIWRAIERVALRPPGLRHAQLRAHLRQVQGGRAGASQHPVKLTAPSHPLALHSSRDLYTHSLQEVQKRAQAPRKTAHDMPRSWRTRRNCPSRPRQRCPAHLLRRLVLQRGGKLQQVLVGHRLADLLQNGKFRSKHGELREGGQGRQGVCG